MELPRELEVLWWGTTIEKGSRCYWSERKLVDRTKMETESVRKVIGSDWSNDSLSYLPMKGKPIEMGLR